MVRAFSEDLKWRIVFLYHDGYSQENIAELLYISKSTVKKVLQIYIRWGTVVDPWRKPSGRHKTLTRDDMKVFYARLQREVTLFLNTKLPNLNRYYRE